MSSEVDGGNSGGAEAQHHEASHAHLRVDSDGKTGGVRAANYGGGRHDGDEDSESEVYMDTEPRPEAATGEQVDEAAANTGEPIVWRPSRPPLPQSLRQSMAVKRGRGGMVSGRGGEARDG